jgi:hypothetical protein
MALGKLLRLDANAYLLLGVPLSLAFQLFVARAPLRAVWMRDVPPIVFDKWTGATALALSVMPCISLVQAARAHAWVPMGWCVAAIAGAFAAACAARVFPRRAWRPLLLCLAVAGGIGAALFVAAMLSQHFVRHTPFPVAVPALGEFAKSLLLYVPVCFVLEEVSFRGVLDAHVQHEGEKRGVATAFFVSALWGLWHLPTVGSPKSAAELAVVIFGLLFVHTLVGVPLSLFYRRGGTLWVPVVAHAFADAVRNALMSRG